MENQKCLISVNFEKQGLTAILTFNCLVGKNDLDELKTIIDQLPLGKNQKELQIIIKDVDKSDI
jgi:hypothetical protein